VTRIDYSANFEKCRLSIGALFSEVRTTIEGAKMEARGIKPTVTHLVRDFLSEQDAPVQPWSTLDETYTALYSLLKERRHDQKFWEPLAGLLQSIVDNAVRPYGWSRLSIPHAELLTSWDIDALLHDLRWALPNDENESSCSEVKLFCTKLSAPVLTGFLLLGLALSGCTSDIAETTEQLGTNDASGIAEDSSAPVVVPEWHTGCSLQESSIFFETIGESALEDGEKSVLCECLSSIHTSWHPSLKDVFSNGTPELIAAVLESMLNCCEQSPEELTSRYGGSSADLIGIENRGCNVVENFDPVALYKGVSFPK